MAEARLTLVVACPSLAAAQTLSEVIEADIRLEPLAVAINETDETRGLWEVVAYFADAGEAERARSAVGGDIRLLASRDWVRESLAGLSPVSAGRFFLHGSHDRQRRRRGGISLEIDAGTAFGTGHHGTTEGCLSALDGLVKRQRPSRILDVGCGTGVLAIAAARVTGAKVLASDIDPEAVRVTARNAHANGVGPRVRALTAAGLNDIRIARAAPFDLVFANILARPLAELARGFSLILSPGGHLILSGITGDQQRWIAALYRNHGFLAESAIRIGNWATLVLTRGPKKKRPDHSRGGRLQPGPMAPAGKKPDRSGLGSLTRPTPSGGFRSA